MGLFRITIEGLGGHGVDRGKGDGETVYFDIDGETADFLAARLVLDLRAKGVEVKKATLEHWPADLGYDWWDTCGGHVLLPGERYRRWH